MPRFFIHIHNGSGAQTDETGQEFIDARRALGQAAGMAGEIVRDEIREKLADRTVRVIVAGDDGMTIGEIELHVSVVAPT